MERRSALALLLTLLILPFVRFLEEWGRPEFRRIVREAEKGIRWVRASDVRMTIGGQEISLEGMVGFRIEESY